MEEGNSEVVQLPRTLVANGSDSLDQMKGSSKADLIATTPCENEGHYEKLTLSDDTFLDRLLIRYAKFLVGYPYVNIIIVCILVIWAAVIGFIPKLGAQKLPNFTKPTKGFEARGTELSNSELAYRNLQKAISKAFWKRLPRSLAELDQFCSYSFDYESSYILPTNKIIYEDKSGGNMLNTRNMIDVCTLQKSIMEENPFYIGEVQNGNNGKMCPSFSVPNYIALLGNHSSCLQITDSDVSIFKSLLNTCAKSFRDGSLKTCLTNTTSCINLAPSCAKSARIIYYTFHFLSDSGFASNPNFLKLTVVSERLKSPYENPLYESVFDKKLADLSGNTMGNVKVAAFYFYDLKFKLFEKKLFLEGTLLSVAVLIVFILIMIYSRSIFIGLMTFLCIIIATVLAYFLYGIVYRISFFPFLNVLTLIFLVGIGADDAFVYMGAWNEAMKLMPSHDTSSSDALVRWTVYSLKHAVAAMFVTSFTTAAAFFASASSKIIAIRCFGIFAGTSILMNYLMMVVWFPVAVIISFKYFGRCHCPRSSCCRNSLVSSTPGSCAQKNSRFLSKTVSFFKWFSEHFFTETIPNIVNKFRYLWLALFTLLGIGGIIVLFVSPKLKLPVTKDFQMFSDTSAIEQFDLKYKSYFSADADKRWVSFIFGVNNENTANMWEPDNKGSLRYAKTFSVTSPAEQSWLKSFCERLKNASFITPQSYNQGACPKILSIFQKLILPCNNSNSFSQPCCGGTFPLPQATFSGCLTSLLPNSSKTYYTPSGFLIENRRVKAITVTAETPFRYTDAHDKSNDYFMTVNSWFKTVTSDAPEGFDSAFWRSSLDFYDLQKSLASGTQVSLGISVAIAFSVVLLTTWNLLVSLLTIVSISFVMSTSMGVLVLAGWKLNIMESLIFSVAVGLAVDFTLHYGVAYRSATDKSSRRKRVDYSFAHLGSAVAMGAFTTFISGMVMSPATVLVYIQLSHFLMVLMTFSWVYANFFFMSLCIIIGPQNDICQLNIFSLLLKKREKMHVTEDGDHHQMEPIT